MKMRLSILMLAVLCLSYVVGCNDVDEIVEKQRTDIERYLTSTHSPRLVSAEQAEQDGSRDFYDVFELNTYRYIATLYDEGRNQRTFIDYGDQISLSLTAYTFTGSVPRAEAVYFTNEEAMIGRLTELGLNTEYWTTDPVVIKLGETNIIKGVEQSLIGCCEGDRVEVYMTLETGYESEAIGIVPTNSSLVWIFNITSVVKD